MSRCKSCGAEIRWIKMSSGKSMPVDPDQVPYWARRRHIRPEIANTSEGPVIRKMVPLDDLKRCADLCSDIGWTLQEFRKNMDEWDEDTIEITETE